MRDYLRIAFDRVPISADTRGPVTRLAQKCISLPARWRLDHQAYRFPVELWLNKKLKQRKIALKPAVDAKRLEPNTVEATC
jgi:anaerobic magnesium-protoporphyrin IX monomethyl ester cyclase